MLELKNLTKRYGSFVAVDNISLTVKPGEVFGFLGVNGAGKTTTLRMIAGILTASSGSVSLHGNSISSFPRKVKKTTGYIPDRPYLYGKLRARELLEFMADLYEVPRREALNRAEELMSEYGLLEVQEQLVESFSHGMKQRLATCAALIHSPTLLIVDEPMVGLDPHGAKLLKAKFREYAEKGMTVFLSTHSLNVAQEVSDRLAIIQHGKIVASGAMADLKAMTSLEDEDLEQVFLEITREASPLSTLHGESARS